MKLQQYFDINDMDKLKEVSHSDPYKLGDEECIRNIKKAVPKCPEQVPQPVSGSRHDVPPKSAKGEELKESDSKKKGSNKPDEPGLSAKSKEKLNKSDVPKSCNKKPAKPEENSNKHDVPDSNTENKGKGEEKPSQIESENKDLSGNKDSENKPEKENKDLSGNNEGFVCTRMCRRFPMFA